MAPAFGKGLHFCIGAALARVEGQVVLPAVLRRFADLSLVARATLSQRMQCHV